MKWDRQRDRNVRRTEEDGGLKRTQRLLKRKGQDGTFDAWIHGGRGKKKWRDDLIKIERRLSLAPLAVG